jgi:hypothetical protein
LFNPVEMSAVHNFEPFFLKNEETQYM